MRILHFADTHFGMENYGRIDPKTGLHSRFLDFQKSFQFVVDHAIDNRVDLVVFAGDAFKTRDPSPTYLRAFGEGIRQIAAADVPVVLLVGNHDLPNATGKANTLDIFSTLAVPKVTVSRQSEYLRIETRSGIVQVVTLPWIYKSQLLSREEVMGLTGEEVTSLFQNKIRDQFRVLLTKVKDDKPAIAAVHATVEGATFGSERTVLLGSDIVLPLRLLTHPKLDYVALGHLHRRQVLNEDPPVIYSGSLERIDFAEENEGKGFIVADITKKKTSYEFVDVPVRRFVTIEARVTDTDLDPTTTAVNVVKRADIKNAVVRVIISCDESRAPEIREIPIREALTEANFVAGIIKQVSRGVRVSEERGFSDALLSASPLDILEEYWKEKNIPHPRIERLRDASKELLDAIEG